MRTSDCAVLYRAFDKAGGNRRDLGCGERVADEPVAPRSPNLTYTLSASSAASKNPAWSGSYCLANDPCGRRFESSWRTTARAQPPGTRRWSDSAASGPPRQYRRGAASAVAGRKAELRLPGCLSLGTRRLSMAFRSTALDENVSNGAGACKAGATLEIMPGICLGWGLGKNR